MNLLSVAILLGVAPIIAVSAESLRGANPSNAGDVYIEHHGTGDHHCYDLYSPMAYNNLLQSFHGRHNPDSGAQGYATCKLCTNGHMTCDATVTGGKSQLWASHIHRANNGDGNNGSGPPVINFCGSNTMGMVPPIDDGTVYKDECAMYSNGYSQNNNMLGNKVAGTTEGESVEHLVNDIGNYPEKYYFNFHSVDSWHYWLGHTNGKNPAPKGMCRGVMMSSGQLELEEERD